jgi:hypothetical protein
VDVNLQNGFVCSAPGSVGGFVYVFFYLEAFVFLFLLDLVAVSTSLGTFYLDFSSHCIRFSHDLPACVLTPLRGGMFSCMISLKFGFIHPSKYGFVEFPQLWHIWLLRVNPAQGWRWYLDSCSQKVSYSLPVMLQSLVLWQ